MVTIWIRQIHAAVRLGCLDSEKLGSQPVVIDVKIKLKSEASLISDKLEDTLSYGDVVKQVLSVCRQKHFHLIEHLAHSIRLSLEEHFGEKANFTIHLKKIAPPVEGITGGVEIRL